MPNIKFSYFYRDGANYKKFDDVIFANPDSVNLSEIESIISGKLIEETWFYADEWKLPELFLNTFHFRVDPTWHEFESIEYTDEVPNSVISLSEFIEAVKRTKLPW
jgi:hypothetical protein